MNMSAGLQEHNNKEQHMIAGCRKGDPAAQRLLYDTYVDTIMILCLRYISDRGDARELLMDAFLNCYKHIGSFQYKGAGSLRAWLQQIAVNQCLMYLRKRRLAWQDIEGVQDLGDESAGSGLDNLSAKEILQYIQELPEGYRTVFNLYAFDAFSHKEIAGALGITESTSKSQLHKARALLQKRVLAAQKSI
jgi:RNA polymerase sigma-70 factor (ECF subfamily)